MVKILPEEFSFVMPDGGLAIRFAVTEMKTPTKAAMSAYAGSSFDERREIRERMLAKIAEDIEALASLHVLHAYTEMDKMAKNNSWKTN